VRIPEKVTAWWLRLSGWFVLAMIAGSWLLPLPMLVRAFIGAAGFVVCVKSSAALRARRVRDERGGAR
jgi:hypothetical protein